MEVIVERREDNKKRFIIIDGSSLMYRAFFALPLLTSSSGIYTMLSWVFLICWEKS